MSLIMLRHSRASDGQAASRWLFAGRKTFAWAVVVILFVVIPWTDIRGGFTDLVRYQTNFSTGAYGYRTDVGLLGLWHAETLWRWGVPKLAHALGGYREALGLISLFAIGSLSLYPASRSAHPSSLVLLFAPHFVDLTQSQVRSAAAVALVYVGLMFAGPALGWLSVLSLAAACFTHTFALAPVGLILAFAVSRLMPEGSWRRRLCLAAAVILLVFILTVLKDQILFGLGDRRAGLAPRALSGVLLTVLLLSTTVPAWLRLRDRSLSLPAYLVIGLSCVCGGLFLAGDVGGARVVAMALPALAVVIGNIASPQERWTWTAYVASAHLAYFSVWAGGADHA